MSKNSIHIVPEYDMPEYSTKKQKRKKNIKPVDEFAFSHEDRALCNRMQVINKTIESLKQERQEILTVLKKRQMLRNEKRLRPVKLYALELEDECWYIGMSYDPFRRFIKHSNGKGAQWTKRHKPIRVHEVRDTREFIQDNAAKLEDDMTLEYALKYGSHYVRGGGYTQAKPRWPDVIVQNESTIL